jgi:signal transduction histidine kinase/CheY-like chemotaxis protein
MDRVRAEAIRTLFAQIRNHAPAALVVILYMVGAAWPFTPWRVVVGWVAFALVPQGLRLALKYAFLRSKPSDEAVLGWARLYALNAGLIGITWATSFVLFAHPAQPITVALSLSCLYSIASGSTPSHAYYPPSLYAMVLPIFAVVLTGLLATGQWGYILLGVASSLYGVTMAGFCRTQARTIDDGLRIRFENRSLVDALTVQKAEAEGARRQAELASLAKSQFLAAASHDLRQPLYALNLFSASLDTLKLDADGRAVVGKIQDSVQVMESLFVGMLDLSKLEAGVVQPQLKPVSVDSLFDRLSQYFRPVAMERGLDLRFHSADEWVTSDEVLIEQVTSNLVSNALRCTKAGGVLVAARPRAGTVRLEVWDTGIGIGPANIQKIFDEFVQLDNPERDRRKGLGLGLSIAKRSAALIGGAIEVRSRPGKGSRFAFTQPAAASGSVHPVIQSATPRAVCTVARDVDLPLLVVEDDDDVRGAIGQLFSRWGVLHHTVATADAALRRISAGERFGLVLTDYRLGGDMNGLQLIDAIGAAHPAPVPATILITGDFDPSLIEMAKTRGVSLLLKPIRPGELQDLLGLPAAVGRAKEHA